MSTYFTPARHQTLADRLIGAPGKLVQVAEAIHRTPPRWRRQRSANGQMVKLLMPAGTKVVPVYGLAFVDTGKDYRGRLGAKDMARRARVVGE